MALCSSLQLHSAILLVEVRHHRLRREANSLHLILQFCDAIFEYDLFGAYLFNLGINCLHAFALVVGINCEFLLVSRDAEQKVLAAFKKQLVLEHIMAVFVFAFMKPVYV